VSSVHTLHPINSYSRLNAAISSQRLYIPLPWSAKRGNIYSKAVWKFYCLIVFTNCNLNLVVASILFLLSCCWRAIYFFSFALAGNSNFVSGGCVLSLYRVFYQLVRVIHFTNAVTKLFHLSSQDSKSVFRVRQIGRKASFSPNYGREPYQ
jgi:hypothetical protein